MALAPHAHAPAQDPAPAQDLSSAYAAASAHVETLDPDRYLTTLFAPADKRHHLLALYAFSADVARVRSVIHEALPGEIRFQWWREVLNGERDAEAADNPVAQALLATIAACRLPRKPLLDLIEARTFDLYDDPMPTWLDLEGYCGETSSALMRLAMLVLSDGEDPGGADAAGHAGVAYALTGLLRAFPWTSRRNQVFVPVEALAAHGVDPQSIRQGQDSPALRAALAEVRARARHHLEQTRRAVADLPPALAPALLPVALVRPYLEALERAGANPFTNDGDISRLRKLWVLWRQARRAGCR